METIQATVDLPKSVLVACRTRVKELPKLVKLSFVLKMYREGIISLGKATEILDVTKWEMPGIPKDRGIPLNYDVEELEEDRKTWKMLEK